MCVSHEQESEQSSLRYKQSNNCLVILSRFIIWVERWTWIWTYRCLLFWGYKWFYTVNSVKLISTVLLRIHFRQFLEAPSTRKLGRCWWVVILTTAFVIFVLLFSWNCRLLLGMTMLLLLMVLVVQVVAIHGLWFDPSLRLPRHVRNISLHFAAAF